MARRMLIIGLSVVMALVLGVGVWLYTPDRPRAALEAAYAAPPSTFLDVMGLRLHVRDTGPRDAPAVILLHGFGASLQAWDAWSADLERTARVVRLDLPGFGLTGPDPTGDYSDTRAVLVLAALMDRLGLARADLVGHSMGGRIAWTFAAAYPDRVNRLVLMAPDGFASPGMAYGVTPKIPLLARVLPYTLPTALLRASLAPAYADRAVMTETVITRFRDMMLTPGVRAAILARMEQNVLLDPESSLRRITAPTLLIWGDKDAMIPIANAGDYLRDLPYARLVTLPGVGHVAMEEAPVASATAVREFLAGGAS